MKSSTIILGIVVLALGLGVYAYLLLKTEPANIEKYTQQANSESLSNTLEDFCFYKSEFNKRTGLVSEYKLNIYIIGDQVEGDLVLLKDDGGYKTGMFYGTIGFFNKKRTIDVWWDAHTEFKNSKEELRIVLENDLASIGMGVMQDNGDGTFFYKNKNSISYSLKLEKTICQ